MYSQSEIKQHKKLRTMKFMDYALMSNFETRFSSSLSSGNVSLIEKVNKKLEFVTWISFSPKSAVAKATLTLNSTPVAVKLVHNKKLYQQEKAALNALARSPHIISLLESFELQEYNCFGLIFPLYSEEYFRPFDAQELYSYMWQLLKVVPYMS